MDIKKQAAFVSLISSGTERTEHRLPPHRQCYNVSSKLLTLSKTTIMTLSKTTIIVATILFIAIFLLGMLSYSTFFYLTLPRIDGVVYQTNSMTGSFTMPFIYSLTLAGIPIATILLWKRANIHSATKRILVPMVLFICIATATWLRQYKLTTDIKKTAEITQSLNEQTKDNIKTTISLDNLDIEKYLLLGLIAGIVVVYFAMRPKTPTANNSFAKVGLRN